MKRYEFDTIIIKHPKINSGYIEFPYDVEKEFGKKGQVKVKAWFDGFLYRGSLVRMKLPCYWIGITQEVRSAIRKESGETIHVIIEEDLEERTVIVPKELMDELNKYPQAKDKFDAFSYTNKKELITYFSAAKKEETRTNRLNKIIEKLMG